MWWDLLLFVPLAVVTNTALPLPFEPLLIYFATPYAAAGSVVFAALGSLCAGVAGVADVRLARTLSPLVPPAWLAWLPRCGRGAFYAWTALLAASPLPFSVVRVALLRQRPRALPYAMAVTLGRLPRFLLTVSVWRALAMPAWANAVLLLAGLALPLWGWRRRPRAVAALLALALMPGATLRAQEDGELRARMLREAIAQVDADCFDEALSIAEELRREWPEDPGGYLAAANAYQTMMRDYRLRDHEPEFEAMIARAEALAATGAKAHPTAEAFFVLGAARGYRAVHRSRQGAWLPALREGLRSLHDMDRALALDPEFPDPLLSLGLYDYWKSRKLSLGLGLFGGTRERAIRRLETVWDHGRYLAVDAGYSLQTIYLREGHLQRALAINSMLHTRYPANPTALYHRGLLLERLGRPGDAEAAWRELAERLIASGRVSEGFLAECQLHRAENLARLGERAQAQEALIEAQDHARRRPAARELEGPLDDFDTVRSRIARLLARTGSARLNQ